MGVCPSRNRQVIQRVTSTGKQLTSQGHVVPPAQWGITPAQIRDFHSKCQSKRGYSPKMTARKFVNKFVEPCDKSVALMYNDDCPKSIEWLISHSWDEGVHEFLIDVLSIGGFDDPLFKDGVFICFLSVFQGSPDEINLQVTQGSTDIYDGCFYQVLTNVRDLGGFMYVIPNENLKDNGQGLYSRLWCAWEVHCCQRKQVPFFTWPKEKMTQQHLFGDCEIDAFSAEHGHCGPPKHWGNKDEQNIKAAIKNWDKINEDIRRTLSGTCGAGGDIKWKLR